MIGSTCDIELKLLHAHKAIWHHHCIYLALYCLSKYYEEGKKERKIGSKRRWLFGVKGLTPSSTPHGWASLRLLGTIVAPGSLVLCMVLEPVNKVLPVRTPGSSAFTLILCPAFWRISRWCTGLNRRYSDRSHSCGRLGCGRESGEKR